MRKKKRRRRRRERREEEGARLSRSGCSCSRLAEEKRVRGTSRNSGARVWRGEQKETPQEPLRRERARVSARGGGRAAASFYKAKEARARGRASGAAGREEGERRVVDSAAPSAAPNAVSICACAYFSLIPSSAALRRSRLGARCSPAASPPTAEPVAACLCSRVRPRAAPLRAKSPERVDTRGSSLSLLLALLAVYLASRLLRPEGGFLRSGLSSSSRSGGGPSAFFFYL